MTEAVESEVAREPLAAPMCSHCGFTLPKHGGGLRHYGTHTAHQESECFRLLHAEIDRLRAEVASLRKDAERLVAAERERCALICDVTPPYPFRPSIEAAHAIRQQGQA